MANTINVPDIDEKKEFPPLPVVPGGEYAARLSKITSKPGYNPGDGEQWLWEFRLFAPYADHPLWLWTSQKLGAYTENGVTKKSKARMALEALLGRDLEAHEELSLDDLIGLNCTLMVAREPKKDATQVSLKDGTGWRNKITAVVPFEEVTTTTGQMTATAAAKSVQVEVSSLDLQLQKRFDDSVRLLGWKLPQIKEVINYVASSDDPFFKLSTAQKTTVVEYLEQEVSSVDVPFDVDPEPSDDELDQAGLTPVGAGATAPASKQPASTKHRVS